jgi:hypothetical protein
MEKYSKKFIKETIEVWQPFSDVPLSSNDAREISENMINLFNFLIKVDNKYDKERGGQD